MNRRVVTIISSSSAIMAAFVSSVPRMISMYFGIAFSSSGGAASRPSSHTSNERPADRHGPGETSRRDAFDTTQIETVADTDGHGQVRAHR